MSRVDQVVHEFEGAVERLQYGLEELRGMLPELLAVEVRRERLRFIRALADDGIFDGLQRLANALECSGPELPESLVVLKRSARLMLDRICRAFEVQAVYQPGETLTVTEQQTKDFDWSADQTNESTFPDHVAVLRSGWKVGETVFVLPRAVRLDQQNSKEASS